MKAGSGSAVGLGGGVPNLGGPAAAASREKEPGERVGPDHRGLSGSSPELHGGLAAVQSQLGPNTLAGGSGACWRGSKAPMQGGPWASRAAGCPNHPGTFLRVENVTCCFHPRMPQQRRHPNPALLARGLSPAPQRPALDRRCQTPDENFPFTLLQENLPKYQPLPICLW